ncbi:hypothetical protein QAD02_021609, partial [Eretmocerus hayati]
RRRGKTTLEVLNELDKKLEAIEEYGRSTDQRHRKIVRVLIFYSSALYIIIASLFYSYYSPSELSVQLMYVAPFLIFPFLIFISKRIITWYYRKKILKFQKESLRIQNMKQKILDDISKTDAFRNAKEILLKFGNEQRRRLS